MISPIYLCYLAYLSCLDFIISFILIFLTFFFCEEFALDLPDKKPSFQKIILKTLATLLDKYISLSKMDLRLKSKARGRFLFFIKFLCFEFSHPFKSK